MHLKYIILSIEKCGFFAERRFSFAPARWKPCQRIRHWTVCQRIRHWTVCHWFVTVLFVTETFASRSRCGQGGRESAVQPGIPTQQHMTLFTWPDRQCSRHSADKASLMQHKNRHFLSRPRGVRYSPVFLGRQRRLCTCVQQADGLQKSLHLPRTVPAQSVTLQSSAPAPPPQQQQQQGQSCPAADCPHEGPLMIPPPFSPLSSGTKATEPGRVAKSRGHTSAVPPPRLQGPKSAVSRPVRLITHNECSEASLP